MIVGAGRPLRFLVMVSGGWVMLRVALVWQTTGSLQEAVRGILPIPGSAIAAVTPAEPAAVAIVPARRPPSAMAALSPARPPVPDTAPIDPMHDQFALLAMTRLGSSGDVVEPAVGALPQRPMSASPFTRATAPTRLSISSWMIARSGMGLGATSLSPQLGGTQGGVRIDYALTRGIAATARVAAPAAGAGRELSLGIAWRPAGVPLRFVVEQRLALDGGRGGPSLGISGGVSEVPLPGGFRLEGYGQAGAILRDGVEKYLDASVRAARPIAELGGIVLDVGGGAWGGAQRGVARLDVGPSIGARVPLAGQPVRVSLDWRHRIAGNARPGSGPALTLGTDF